VAEVVLVEITCKRCGEVNRFEQPYVYHAGFADRCFLYNDAGNLTLVWSCVDPDFEAIVGPLGPRTLTRKVRARFESALADAPSGGRWRFGNPARCVGCGRTISSPMTRSTAFLVYDGSLVLDDFPSGHGLARVLLPGAGRSG
jgi:hypothetical protein